MLLVMTISTIYTPNAEIVPTHFDRFLLKNMKWYGLKMHFEANKSFSITFL